MTDINTRITTFLKSVFTLNEENLWIHMSGLMGLSAVGIGAIGAHAILHSTEAMKETWKTSSLYHLIHACALGIAATTFHNRKRHIVCGCFTTGIICFSGALYTSVLMNAKRPYTAVAPIGGIMLMAGWAAFGFM